MTFIRENLPDPRSFFEGEGLQLKGGKSKWLTTSCTFHDGSDSMRINTQTGAWVCMSCGEKGGDVLGYYMASHGIEFVDACKALGAWVDDGKPQAPQKPKPLPPQAALSVLSFEATLAAVAACNLAHGVQLTPNDLERLQLAAGRINQITEAYQ